MNPYKLRDVFKYLTSNNQLLKKKLKLGTSEIPIPPKRQDVIDVEVINRFSKANPRVNTTNLQPLSVKHSNVKKPDEAVVQDAVDTTDMKAEGGRIGYNQGSSLDSAVRTVDPVQDSGNKIEEVLKAYGRYRGSRKGKRPMKFKNFFELYSTENFAEGGRAGYEDGGMLVQPSDDGSRPGYKGKPGEYDRGSFTEKQQKKIKDAFPKTKFNFSDYKYGVPVYNKPGKTGGTNKDYTKIIRFIDQGYKIKEFKTDLLKKPIRELVMANFELPSGVDEWNFNKYKYGIPGTGTDGANQNIGKRISKYIKEKPSWTLAADRSSAKGWMMSAMERLYNNQKGKTKNLTYDPIFETINGKKIIIGFTDNTESGKGKNYFGLKKYEKKNNTPWINHGDYKNVSKFVDISKRSFNEPNNVIKNLLKQKGINQSLKLNDILNFDRYFETLNKTTSKELLKNAIVKHHISGVGGGTGSGRSINIANAAATKDLQLLTSANNNNVRKIENKLKTNGFISAEDNLTLKNLGASIRGANGKLYGGGSTTAIGGFKAIEKQAEEIVKGDKFNVKNIKKYVAALGGGTCSVFSGKKTTLKADGGRIGLATGTPNIDDCYKSGSAVINSGKVPVDKADDFTKLLKRVGTIGKNVMKFGIIPEAMYVAADSLVRLGMGNTFKEAGLLASDYLLPGDQAKASEISKVKRFFGDETGELVGRVIDYKNQLAKIQSLEDQVSNLDNLSDVGEFSYTGDLSGESNTKKNLLSQAKNDLDNKFKISEAEQLYAESKQDDAYDASAANSLISTIKRKYGNSSNNTLRLEDIETLAAPEKTQMQLNLDMLPAVPKEFMMATDDALRNYVRAESVRSGEKLNPQLYIDEKEKLKKEFMTKGPGVYGKEQVYGTQGTFGGEPVDMTNYKPSNRFSGFKLGLASGGIASLTDTIPPESGPTPQGLPYVYNNVKKI